jgi:outer membrane lipopolysaccharide assembly protein LptE/RlpB
MLVDCIGRLKSQRIKLRREYLHEQIKKAQTSGEEEALRALMREFQDLFKQGVGKK